MSVHVNEVHTTVVPTGGPPMSPQQPATNAQQPGAAEEAWAAAARMARRLEMRTAARGFDD